LSTAEAEKRGWIFGPQFTDKVLRDRVRCYYKTHIQNAKKRLQTMLKNPTKRSNARHLCEHWDMIHDVSSAEKATKGEGEEEHEEEGEEERSESSEEFSSPTSDAPMDVECPQSIAV